MKKEVTYSGAVVSDGKLYLLFDGAISDVQSQYASGDVVQLDDAVDTLRACAEAVDSYADAGRAAVLKARCNNVAEGQECYVTTKTWGEKKAMMMVYNGGTDTVAFALYRADGSLGNPITRSIDLISVSLEPTAPAAAEEGGADDED